MTAVVVAVALSWFLFAALALCPLRRHALEDDREG